jgi:hypothetical protein
MLSSGLTEDGETAGPSEMPVTTFQTTRRHLQTLSSSSSPLPICNFYQIPPLLPCDACFCPPRQSSPCIRRPPESMWSGLTATRSGVWLCNRRPQRARDREAAHCFQLLNTMNCVVMETKLCLPPPVICSSADRAERLHGTAGRPQLT